MSEPTVGLSPRTRVIEVAGLFLRLGFTAFGGPAAHVALIEEEVVTRRKWLDRRHFLDIVSAVNFIPGPNSTELVIHLGYLRAGLPGLVVAGACFITPAMLIVLALAWCYLRSMSIASVAQALVGIKACMVAIIGVALWRFFTTGVKDRFTAGIALVAGGAAVVFQKWGLPQSELIILALAAVAGMIYYGRSSADDPGTGGLRRDDAHPGDRPGDTSIAPRRSLMFPMLPLAAGGFVSQLLPMTLFFLKVGATLFGSGYVLTSFLHSGVVEQHHWMTQPELVDAIAVGQVTPGPLLTAATFIGYVVGARHLGGGAPGGIAGGVVATLAIFLPSFLFVALLGPVLPRLRRSPLARGALDGMNAAVVALIAVVTLWLARGVSLTGSGRIDWLSVVLMAGSLATMLATRLNATWVILGAGVAGWAARMPGG